MLGGACGIGMTGSGGGSGGGFGVCCKGGGIGIGGETVVHCEGGVAMPLSDGWRGVQIEQNNGMVAPFGQCSG